ncbi:MAG TPA: HAMP domain-containing sensor histidine kinase [Gemmatimonadaceae bacterium]|nr:HAMP domain-containing sensor histidine kinase [Gemmatimonadaceae bacterium]
MPERRALDTRTMTLVTVLMLTVVLVGVLAFEAWRAQRSHRRIAIDVLREYAEFAAWEYNASFKEGLYSTIMWMLSPVVHEEPLTDAHELKSPAILLQHIRKKESCSAPSTRYAFRVDARSGQVEIAGATLSEGFKSWLADTIARDIRDYKRDWSYSAITGEVDGEPVSIVYQIKWRRDDTPAAAYGFGFCMHALASPHLARVMQHAPILPPSVTHGAPNDSIFSVIVKDGHGKVLYRSPKQYPQLYTGDNTLDYFGGVLTTVALNPPIVESLMIGGLPRSRLPLVLGVLFLAVAMVAIALLQLKREWELARLRSAFIASVSHELRTPLAQIRMFAETLRLGRVRSDPERERSLRIIDQESRRLTHLVENILQFSRAERDVMLLSCHTAELAPIVREALDAFAPIARSRGVIVEASLDESVRAPVDQDALRQILLNLVDNAVKYGPAGQTVRVTLGNGFAGGDRVQLVVEDEGPGIPADEMEQIWAPYYRLPKDAEGSVGGSGIGLSVVRDLTERMGGRAFVANARRSDSQRGSKFVVELPRARDAAAAPVAAAVAPSA